MNYLKIKNANDIDTIKKAIYLYLGARAIYGKYNIEALEKYFDNLSNYDSNNNIHKLAKLYMYDKCFNDSEYTLPLSSMEPTNIPQEIQKSLDDCDYYKFIILVNGETGKIACITDNIDRLIKVIFEIAEHEYCGYITDFEDTWRIFYINDELTEIENIEDFTESYKSADLYNMLVGNIHEVCEVCDVVDISKLKENKNEVK